MNACEILIRAIQDNKQQFAPIETQILGIDNGLENTKIQQEHLNTNKGSSNWKVIQQDERVSISIKEKTEEETNEIEKIIQDMYNSNKTNNKEKKGKYLASINDQQLRQCVQKQKKTMKHLNQYKKNILFTYCIENAWIQTLQFLLSKKQHANGVTLPAGMMDKLTLKQRNGIIPLLNHDQIQLSEEDFIIIIQWIATTKKLPKMKRVNKTGGIATHQSDRERHLRSWMPHIEGMQDIQMIKCAASYLTLDVVIGLLKLVTNALAAWYTTKDAPNSVLDMWIRWSHILITAHFQGILAAQKESKQVQKQLIHLQKVMQAINEATSNALLLSGYLTTLMDPHQQLPKSAASSMNYGIATFQYLDSSPTSSTQ